MTEINPKAILARRLKLVWKAGNDLFFIRNAMSLLSYGNL